MLCITLLCVQPIPILSAYFLCHPYIPLSNLKHLLVPSLFNPRRACAARVTVVVVCVCRLVANSLLKGQFVLKTLSHTQRAMKVKKFVGFSLKPLRCRDTALARCTATRAVGHFYSAENAHAHI